MIIGGEGQIAPQFGYKNDFTDRGIPEGLSEQLAQYDVIQSLDFYAFSRDACLVHDNVFIFDNENIPFNPVYWCGDSASRNHLIIHRKARHFIAVSESVRECLIAEGIGESRITVIPFWATVQSDEIGYDHSMREDRFNRRAELGLPDTDKFMVLYVGRSAEEKGIGLLREVVQMMDEAFLVEVGCHRDSRIGKDYQISQRTPKELNRYYNVADVLVLPSLNTLTWREQFGRVLMEAQACGLPQVATDIGGPRDIVKHGITGFLIPSNNLESLGGVLERLRDDDGLRESMGKCSIRRWRNCYNPKMVERQVQECYEKNFYREEEVK